MENAESAIANSPNEQVLDNCCIDMQIEQPEGTEGLVVQNGKFWTLGQTIKVAFVDGTAAQQASVMGWANEWSEHANLIFKWGVPVNDSDLRVGFNKPGNWSYVGTDAGGIPKTKQTINIRNVDRRTTLHEFGHAIGCGHEQSSPLQDIQWNKPAVYRDLGGPPNNWDKAKVDYNVFRKYSRQQTQFSQYDSTSIMQYAINASWTLNGFSVPWNNVLSQTDKDFISAVYPGSTISFAKPELSKAHCNVETGPGTLYNQRYGNSWIMHSPGSSYIQVNFNQVASYGGKRVYDKVVLRMLHLTSMAYPNPGHAPIDILVNGKTFKNDYVVPSGNWYEDSWDITSLVEDGANTIRINFKDGARTNYWIHSLKVICSGGEPLIFTQESLSDSMVSNTFQRKNPTNGWHTGKITRVSDTELKWTNNAGASWALYPDEANSQLKTGEDCPYYEKANGKAFLIQSEGGKVTGFSFQNEIYHAQTTA